MVHSSIDSRSCPKFLNVNFLKTHHMEISGLSNIMSLIYDCHVIFETVMTTSCVILMFDI